MDVGADSESVASSWGLGVLMSERAMIPTGYATFQETRRLKVMHTPLEISGELTYRAPDYLRKTVVHPMFEEMEVVGRRLYLSDLDNNRRRLHLDQHPALAGMVAAILGTLSGNLSAVEQHFRHSFRGTQDSWRLDLTPHSIDLSQVIEKVSIEGEGSRVLQVETRYASGDVSLMRIHSAE